ncbi:hypothetical protein SAMN04488051_11182 [Alkalimonas amylolytica]|uniref:Uncharacterized protein n=1 Tax=Alkalimonas amylolytica TaxID=152573 RepID=A0A1H4FP15_ALKAM|nr:hypothetical protein SAMN04488051_11182 [Alkalimonas amylolytica]
MFESHNKYTILTYWTLALSSVVGFVVMGMLIPSATQNQTLLMYILISVLSVMLLLNTYLAYKVFKRSVFALKWCLWLYGLQIIGFETANWGFSLIFGLQINISWAIGESSLTINLMAIIIWFLVFKALRSVNAANKLSQQDAASGAAA